VVRGGSASLLLALLHGLELCDELPLRQRAGAGLVHSDVGHAAHADAGDLDFECGLLVSPAAVDGDGGGLGGHGSYQTL